MPRKKCWRAMMQEDAVSLVGYALETFLDEHEGLTMLDLQADAEAWFPIVMERISERYVREWDKGGGRMRRKRARGQRLGGACRECEDKLTPNDISSEYVLCRTCRLLHHERMGRG